MRDLDKETVTIARWRDVADGEAVDFLERTMMTDPDDNEDDAGRDWLARATLHMEAESSIRRQQRAASVRRIRIMLAEAVEGRYSWDPVSLFSRLAECVEGLCELAEYGR